MFLTSASLRRLSLCLTLAGVLAASSAWGFNQTHQWPVSTKTFTANINSGQLPGGSAARNAFLRAVTAWEAIPGNAFNFVIASCTTCPSGGTNDGINVVQFGPLGGNTLGVTNFWFNTTTQDLLDADVTMDNSNRTWSFTPSTNTENPFGSPFEFEVVMFHELGHAIGLGHEDTELANMNSLYHFAETYVPTPVAKVHADEHRIRVVYPAGGTDTDIGVSDFHASQIRSDGIAPVIDSPFARTGSGSLSPPANISVTAGNTINIQWTQENYGTATTTFDIAFMLSTNTTVSMVDQELGRNFGAFVSREFQATFSRTLTIPKDVATGSYWVGPFLDPDDVIAERRNGSGATPSNNAMRNPVRVDVVGGPDLEITAFSSPAEVRFGCSSFNVSFTVANTGGDPAGAFRVGIQEVSSSIFFPPSQKTLATVNISGLAAGATQTVSTTVTLPPDAFRGEGSFFTSLSLQAVADDQAAVAELSETNNTASNAFALPVPHIFSITDVGNDQGRSVRINLDNSSRDFGTGSSTPIFQYEAFRRIDPLPATKTPEAGQDGGALSVEQRIRQARADGMKSDVALLTAGWEFVGAIPAHAQSEYNMIVPTLADSTATNGIHWSFFLIRAATDNPAMFFDSCVDSGYSVDNLAPNVPTPFTVVKVLSGDVGLEWGPNQEEDFRFYTLYRGSAPDFVPDVSNRVTQLTTTNFTDPGATGFGSVVYYKLTATDFAGNESDVASASTDVATSAPAGGGLPTQFAFYNMGPNPVRARSLLGFDLPMPTKVSLRIYDLRGRLVRAAIDGEVMPAGRHTWQWNRRDGRGQKVAAGVYVYKLSTPQYTHTLKALLVR